MGGSFGVYDRSHPKGENVIKKYLNFVYSTRKLHDCVLYLFQGVDCMVDEKNTFLC